jgi:hypothetical protein
MLKYNLTQRSEIRKDWGDALINCMLHPEFIELEGLELKKWESRDPKFLTKFSSDVKEFLEMIPHYREHQLQQLLEADPVEFAYLNDEAVDFAKYDGTECRVIYRVFFALKGYKSFQYILKAQSMDSHAVSFSKDLWSMTKEYA